VRDERNDCFLHYLNYAGGGTVRHQYIGQFTKVIKDVALRADSYSVMHELAGNSYWIVTESPSLIPKRYSASALPHNKIV